MLFDFSEFSAFPQLRSDLDRVEAALVPSVEGRSELTGMLRHLFPGVAKLVRPTLVLVAHYLSRAHDGHAATYVDGPADDRAIAAAVTVELLHVGTLCHDDVMDEADSRRGRASVNARWGNLQAILSGDYLLGCAAEVAAGLGQPEALLVASTFRRMCRGQMIETDDRYRPDRTEEAYLEAITGKTAVLLGTSCKLGAMQSGAGETCAGAFERFGLDFGIAFQINDDILDFVEDAQALGKPAANDAREGVYTLPLLLALRREESVRGRLTRTMSSEDVLALVDSLHATGAIQDAAGQARRSFSSALAALEGAVPASPGREAVATFAHEMLGAVSRHDPTGAA